MFNISSHLEANNLICENQHGFQRGKSYETQLIHTIDDIATDLDNSREIDALFLDFSKAFDKVPHKDCYPNCLSMVSSNNYWTRLKIFSKEELKM